MKKQLISLSFLFFVSAVSAVAQVNDTYVVPAVISAAGASNTRWSTEFYVFNPQPHSLKLTAVYLPTFGGPGSTVDFTILTNESLYASNVLADLFDRSGTGSLLVAALPEKNPSVPANTISRSFVINSKTFNNSSAGSFGQSIRGVWTGLEDFATDGISAIATGVRNSTASGFRTNIGAVNLGRRDVTLRVTVYDETGKVVPGGNNIPFVIPPQAHLQDRLPVSINRGTVEFFLEDPSRTAVVFPYASTIDNVSGDPIYVEPVLLASPSAIFATKRAASTSVGRQIGIAEARDAIANSRELGEIVIQRSGVAPFRIHAAAKR